MNLNIKQQQDALETPASKSIRKKGEEHMFLLSNLKAQHPLAEHVQEAKIVKHLELSKQPIQAAQLDTLQRRLPYLKSIVSINLSFAKLSDQLGGPALLTTLLGKKSRIQVLHLNDNMLGLYSFKVICDFLPINTTLLNKPRAFGRREMHKILRRSRVSHGKPALRRFGSRGKALVLVLVSLALLVFFRRRPRRNLLFSAFLHGSIELIEL